MFGRTWVRVLIGQTKYYEICICCFSASHATLSLLHYMFISIWMLNNLLPALLLLSPLINKMMLSKNTNRTPEVAIWRSLSDTIVTLKPDTMAASNPKMLRVRTKNAFNLYLSVTPVSFTGRPSTNSPPTGRTYRTHWTPNHPKTMSVASKSV